MLQYSVQNSQSFPHPHDPSRLPRSNKSLPSDLLDLRPFAHTHQPQAVLTSKELVFLSPPPAISVKPLPRNPYLKRPSSPITLSPTLPWSMTHLTQVPDVHSSPPSSSTFENVLFPGDVVGPGRLLQGEVIRLLPVPEPVHDVEPANEFEVIRTLGTGSYAVVYLVREVLSRPTVSEDGHMAVFGALEFEGKSHASPLVQYGREYAIKCLSRADLDEEALAAQMAEVTIHQSLRSHPNIVTLYRTFETPAFLLLLLEFVPGEDLFYFLEQARDHCETDCPDSCLSSSRTPPTPGLLSAQHPAQILSRTRLRLISSMFSQMCDAVAWCHDQQVFHRDIKPENFIVTDGWSTSPDGQRDRKVIVKLTDFGLSTTNVESSDMDCGSAPYMSFECRNNLAPTYRPRAADVWSLGIVLINMLYHYNPWKDTTQDACSSFDLFRRQPVPFFMQRFPGMTQPVAEFLATKVFCILEDPSDDSSRIGARELGAWARDLPALLGDNGQQQHGSISGKVNHNRTASASSIQGYPVTSSVPASHRPSSRHPSHGGNPHIRTPALVSRTLSHAPSVGPAIGLELSELSTVFDQDESEVDVPDREQFLSQDAELEVGVEAETESTHSRSASNQKRRKRGARKGKGSVSSACASATTNGGACTPSSHPLPSLPPMVTSNVASTSTQDETLNTLAQASQSLAREISKASKTPSKVSGRSASSKSRTRRAAPEPVTMYPMPVPLLTLNPAIPSPLPSPQRSPAPKKSFQWKLTLRKPSASNPDEACKDIKDNSPISASSSLASFTSVHPNEAGKKAANVSSVIMGLNAPPRPPENPSLWSSRGRRPCADDSPRRNSSPNSTRSGGWPSSVSSASSVTSSNWRSSMSSSRRGYDLMKHGNPSVSTIATSVSSGSWRMPLSNVEVKGPPKNPKYLEGASWTFEELPRGQYANSVGDVYPGPSARKQRVRKPKLESTDNKLEPISERPGHPAQRSPVRQRHDASTSTSDLHDADIDGPKKVQKGQINALAKMLSALRR